MLAGLNAPSHECKELVAYLEDGSNGLFHSRFPKVEPCEGHEGHIMELYRNGLKIAETPMDEDCVAAFKIKMRKAAAFYAVSPQQDDDHLAVTSNTVNIKIKPKRKRHGGGGVGPTIGAT
jgi:hypothetical protein